MITIESEYTQEEIMLRAKENNDGYFASKDPCPALLCLQCPEFDFGMWKCGVLINETDLEESYYW